MKKEEKNVLLSTKESSKKQKLHLTVMKGGLNMKKNLTFFSVIALTLLGLGLGLGVIGLQTLRAFRRKKSLESLTA